MDVIIEEVISPRDQAIIVNHAREMAERVDESVLTSPLRGGLLGAGIGILAACVTGKSPVSYGLWGGVIGGTLASSHRFWFMTGWSCGFCKGASAGLHPLNENGAHRTGIISRFVAGDLVTVREGAVARHQDGATSRLSRQLMEITGALAFTDARGVIMWSVSKPCPETIDATGSPRPCLANYPIFYVANSDLEATGTSVPLPFTEMIKSQMRGG